MAFQLQPIFSFGTAYTKFDLCISFFKWRSDHLGIGQRIFKTIGDETIEIHGFIDISVVRERVLKKILPHYILQTLINKTSKRHNL